MKLTTRQGLYESTAESNYARNLVRGIQKTVKSTPKPAQPVHVPAADFAPSDTSGLQQGMKVEHPKFGYGVVVQMDTSGADRKARIQFDNFGEKTLLLSFAKLRIHE